MNPRIMPLYAGIIFFMFLALYGCILTALFWIQIVQHPFYYQLAQRQHTIMFTELPPRAPILDRTGTHFLAMNTEQVSAFVIPDNISDRTQLDTILLHHFPTAYHRLREIVDKKFMYVQRRLSPEQINIINHTACKDIYLLKEPGRYYPLNAASCIVGITDIDNNGLFGIERAYNQQLIGTPTTVFLEKDARPGNAYFIKTTVPGTAGSPVCLTLDSDLQFLADHALAESVAKLNAREGSVIIMDPDTGDILAMVNVPCFDPQHTKSLDLDTTKVRAITQQYEFGSVFKVFVALAALEEGVVTPDEIVDCQNKTTGYVDGRRINTVHAHGAIPFKDVVALSNNIGIATVAKRLGDHLYDHYVRLGFGRKTGIPIAGESSGFVNPPYQWSKQSVISLSYGYEVTATVLQIALAFCLIARDGIPVHPRLVLSPLTIHQQSTTTLYSADTIAIIKDILRRTTQYGTAQRAAIRGYIVMTKTGTANMLEHGMYNKRKNRYTCAGIIQKGTYKRVIVTCLQESDRPNLFAATTAVPLFETIAEQMLIAERML